jgi:leader peptidase (prepilin peptidase)/N-methyltransferase
MDSITTLYIDVIVVLAGAAIGSFLNVCISRIPEGVSIIHPRSRCPYCGHPIRFYDNIPAISFFLLSGKCRDCGHPIPRRYPLVEILTASLAFIIFQHFGIAPITLVVFLFVCVLIVVSFIDLEKQLIPHILTLTGIPLFAILSVLFNGLALSDVFFGIMVGAGSLYFVAIYYEAITKREGMGGGDVNLLAMLGAFLGVKSILFILLFSSLLGAVVGIAFIIFKGKDMKYELPFGPFLCAAALVYLFFGDYLISMFFLFLRR